MAARMYLFFLLKVKYTSSKFKKSEFANNCCCYKNSFASLEKFKKVADPTNRAGFLFVRVHYFSTSKRIMHNGALLRIAIQHLQSKWISWRPFKVLANSCQLDDVQKCDNNSLEKNHCETKFKHVQNSCRNDELCSTHMVYCTQSLCWKKNTFWPSGTRHTVML